MCIRDRFRDFGPPLSSPCSSADSEEKARPTANVVAALGSTQFTLGTPQASLYVLGSACSTAIGIPIAVGILQKSLP
eukprot:120024-Alexandrium_andersonii.AAC.1